MHPRYWLSPRLRRQHLAAQARLARPATSAAERAEQQLAALAAVWADAVVDVPYYRDLVARGDAPSQLTQWADVAAVPVLTRQALQDDPTAFVRRSGPPQGIQKTAGSTGTPIHVGMNQLERDVMRTVKLAAWQELGYTPDSRLFIMWGHVHLLGSGLTRTLNQARRSVADALLGYRRVNAYVLNPETCAVFAEQLLAHEPVGFIGYASALDLFARYTSAYRDRFRALGMKFVLITTEPPPRPDTLTLIADHFGCPVVQEYGGGDFLQVAFQRAGRPFETYDDLNYVEALAAESGPDGTPLVVSSLYPRYVPLVRYRTGDAVTGVRTDPHGHVVSFERVAGRLNDVIHLPGGDAIHSLSIFHAVHDEPAIFNVQMVLDDDGIELRLVAPQADRGALEARLRPRLTRIHPALAAARFTYAVDVGTSRAGKRRWFIDRRTERPCAASPAS